LKRTGNSRTRFSSLNGLPYTPATNILDFLAGGILDLTPFKYRHTNHFTQIVDVKYFTKENLSSVASDVRGNEGADDGYAFSQHSKVDEISLSTLNELGNEWRGGKHLQLSSHRSLERCQSRATRQRGGESTNSIQQRPMTSSTLCRYEDYLGEDGGENGGMRLRDGHKRTSETVRRRT